MSNVAPPPISEVREKIYSAIAEMGSERSMRTLSWLGAELPRWYRVHLEILHSTPSPSGIMECRLKQYLGAKGIEPDQISPLGWKVRAAMGVLQEPYWLTILSMAGFDVTLPNETFPCGPHMRAHPDAILDNNFLVEFKSISGWGYKKLLESTIGVADAEFGHHIQAQLYLFSANKECCLYLAAPADYSLLQSILRQKKKYGRHYDIEPLYLEWIHRDEGVINMALRRAEMIANDLESDSPPQKEHCVSPEMRVLTTDLHWIPAGELKLGDELIAFDEFSSGYGGRKFQYAKVINRAIELMDAYEVTLSDGTILITTDDHGWLTGGGANQKTLWRTTKQLRASNNAKLIPIARYFRVWDKPNTVDAGWLAGVFDGEGWLSTRPIRPSNPALRAGELGFAQRPNSVLAYAIQYLRTHNFTYSNRLQRGAGKDTRTIIIRGGLAERIRLLGSIRPIRLLEKFNLPSCRIEARFISPVIEKIRPLGKRFMVALETSTKTFFVEGFGAHNSGFEFKPDGSRLWPCGWCLWQSRCAEITVAGYQDDIRFVR